MELTFHKLYLCACAIINLPITTNMFFLNIVDLHCSLYKQFKNSQACNSSSLICMDCPSACRLPKESSIFLAELGLISLLLTDYIRMRQLENSIIYCASSELMTGPMVTQCPVFESNTFSLNGFILGHSLVFCHE